jgi:hypothetical protein
MKMSEYKNGEILNSMKINGHNINKVYYSYFGMGVWECDCSQFKRPKPCTPNFCKHTDEAYLIESRSCSNTCVQIENDCELED